MMALSLWDHDRRLHDLELALGALLEIVGRNGEARAALLSAAQAFKARGDEGAAALLSAPASRAYAR